MKRYLYRKVSLERLSSPEQLDQALRGASSGRWVCFAGILILLVAGVVWSIRGSVLTTCDGEGLLIRRGGIIDVASNSAGVLASIAVSPGQFITAEQPVATVAEPVLLEKLKGLEQSKVDLEREEETALSNNTREASLKLSTLDRQEESIQISLAECERKRQLLTDQMTVKQSLLGQGLVTRQQVLDVQDEINSDEEKKAQLNAQLRQLDADRFALRLQPADLDKTARDQIAQMNLEIDAARSAMNRAEVVRSPAAGQVLEVVASPGSQVSEAQTILSVQPADSRLEVVAYIPSLLAKDVHIGMQAQITPSNVKREEFGFARGIVTYVADFPATSGAMMRYFQNESLVKALSGTGPVTEVRAIIAEDPTTPTGYKWSSSRGPAGTLTSGTLCHLSVVTRSQRPIDLLIPSRSGY